MHERGGRPTPLIKGEILNLLLIHEKGIGCNIWQVNRSSS